MVTLGRVEIDFYVKLVGVESLSLSVAKIVLQAAPGRCGIELGAKQVLSHSIDRRGNDVVGEWRVAVPGVIELVGPISNALDRNRVVAEAAREPGRANVPKVACPLRSRKETQLLGGGWMVETLPLIVKKEEQLVFDDRTADGAAEHVPAQLVSLRSVKSIFPGVRVQLVIAEVLPDVPVETVSARLDGGADDATLEVPELGRRVLRDEVKLLNSVWRRSKADKVVRRLVVVHAVQDKVIGLLAIPVDVRPGSARSIVAVIEAVRIGRHCAGREQGQLNVITGGQGQRIN